MVGKAEEEEVFGDVLALPGEYAHPAHSEQPCEEDLSPSQVVALHAALYMFPASSLKVLAGETLRDLVE